METQNRTVSGRCFRTQAEYEAAKKDAAYIETIKKRYRLDNKEDLRNLIKELQGSKYRFRTILGRDFLEEVDEMLKTADSNTGTKPGGEKHGNSSSKKPASKRKNLEDYDKDMQQSILRELRKRERIRRMIITVCICGAICCFAYLWLYDYQIKRLDAYAGIQQALKGESAEGEDSASEKVVINYDNEEIVVPDVLDEYKTLYNLNKKLIGWVKIDDTYVDYPVLQTSNNEYYLNHNFDQEQDKNGSIFLDMDCSIFPRSTNLIIYGHHMRSGRMFGQLNKYSDEKFFENHRYIQFDTIYEKGTYEVMYVFRSEVYKENEIVFKYYQFIDAVSEVEFDSNMREMAAMSLYDTGVTAEYGDELLTLSTCDYFTNNGRFVVVAKRIQ